MHDDDFEKKEEEEAMDTEEGGGASPEGAKETIEATQPKSWHPAPQKPSGPAETQSKAPEAQPRAPYPINSDLTDEGRNGHEKGQKNTRVKVKTTSEYPRQESGISTQVPKNT